MLLLAAAAVALLVGLAGVTIATQGREAVHTEDSAEGPTDDPYCAVLARPARARVLVLVQIQPDATQAEIAAVDAALEETPEVRAFGFVDQASAFAEAQVLFADQPTVLQVLRVDDVPPRFEVAVTDVSAADALVGPFEQMPAVLDVQADQEDPVPDLFTVLVSLARGEAPLALTAAHQPVDADVVGDLLATAPEDIRDEVVVVAEHLPTLPVAPPTASRAASLVATQAAGWCGRELPPARDAAPTTTAAMETTTTAPG